MPVTANDLKFMASTDGLGGAISAAEASISVNGLFDLVASAEVSLGDVEYRCVFVQNTHATLTLYNARAYIEQNTASPSTTLDIGAGAADVNAPEQSIANEHISPMGVVFVSPSDYDFGVALGDLPPGGYKALWLKRTVSAAASAFTNDAATLAVTGDSAA